MAKDFELAINQVPEEIDLGTTHRRAVQEALFSMGVVKVGICTTGEVMDSEYGEPYADLVSPDDYFVDMSAKSWADIQFEGNDYWMDLEEAKETFGEKKLQDLDGDDHTTVGEYGDERADSVGTTEGGKQLRPRLQLRDVWIPAEQALVTYAVRGKRHLRTVDWDGPKEGPYHKLGFTDVPGNLLPLPPVALWKDLHDLANSLYRKLAKQADSQKNVLGFAGGNDEDVENFRQASDGDGIRYNGQQPQNLTAGGIDQLTLAFYLQNRDLYSYLAGNLDALGGLAPQTETLGQDRLLTESASARMKEMADRVVKFSQGIFKALAWYEWTDPIRQRELIKQIPGTDMEIHSTWSAETRDGDFLDFNFTIDVFSMQDDSPSTRLQKLGMAFQQYIVPLLPMIEAQGGQVNIQELMRVVGEYANLPELTDIVKFQPAIPGQQQGPPVQGNSQPSRMPAHTTRTYERVNRPGATRQGKDYALSQLLMGGKPQADEMAGMMRGIS